MKSRTETKIGTEVAHVTHDSDTTFKIKRSRSPGRFTHRHVNTSGSCSGECGNVLGVETTATLRSAQWHKALQRPQREERGGGTSWRPPDYSLLDALLAVRKLKSYLYAELFSTIVTVAIHCEIITVTEHLSQCRTVVPHCCKGDAASRWEMAILGFQNSVIPEPID